jgi:hypothetical protein
VLHLADLSGSRIAFYATVATVIPIIMLALGFQLRAENIIWSRPRPLGRKAAIFALVAAGTWILVMSFAEYSAFASLADGRNDNYGFVLSGVLIGLFVLTVGTGDAVVDRVIESYREDREQEIVEQEKRAAAQPPESTG